MQTSMKGVKVTELSFRQKYSGMIRTYDIKIKLFKIFNFLSDVLPEHFCCTHCGEWAKEVNF